MEFFKSEDSKIFSFQNYPRFIRDSRIQRSFEAPSGLDGSWVKRVEDVHLNVMPEIKYKASWNPQILKFNFVQMFYYSFFFYANYFLLNYKKQFYRYFLTPSVKKSY